METQEPASPGVTLGPIVPRNPTPAELRKGHHKHGMSKFTVFGEWFLNVTIPDKKIGYWSYLYEWKGEGWVYLLNRHDENWGISVKKAMDAARKLLVEGERPEAEARNAELAHLVAYWKEHGTHINRRDNYAQG